MTSLLDIPVLSAMRHAEAGQGEGGVPVSLQHAILRSFDDTDGLQSEWDEFVARCDGDLYSSFDWCRIWWKHYGHRRMLEVHIFRYQGDIVAIVPTFRESLRLGPIAIRVIRLVGCDHTTTTCGIVIDPTQIKPVVRDFTRWLRADRDWDLVRWSPMAGYFAHRASIVEGFSATNCWDTDSCADEGPHMVWELPETYEQFLASLPKKERSNIKICRKKLSEGASVHDSGESPDGLRRWFPVFVDQHQRQWQAEGNLGHFCDWPGARAFHTELARVMLERGRLWLLRLDAGAEPIGFQYNYRFGRRIHWLLGSRDIDSKWDSYSSGRLLHVETIERAIREKYAVIDGLRGMYEYKLRLGGKVTFLQSITLVRRDAMIRGKVRIVQWLARLLDLIYYRIWFSRVAPKLPFPRRGLWKIWIRSRL